MRRSRLLLVKWYDDVVVTQTLASGQAPDLSSLPAEGGGVSVEVLDVTDDRSSLALRPRFDSRSFLSFAASMGAHIVVAILLITAARGVSREAAENDRAAALRSYMTRIAASDSGGGRPEVEHHARSEELEAPAATTAPVEPPPPPVRPPSVSPRSHGASSGPNPMPGGSDSVSSSPSVCAPTHVTPTTGPMCSETVRVTSLTRSSPSCFTDNVVNVGQVGTLSFPCAGDGEATLRFGALAFEGAEIDGRASVCTGTQFPWSDGCTWTSAQRVSGDVRSGALRFDYGEAPKAGERGCMSACSATGTLAVDRTAAAEEAAD